MRTRWILLALIVAALLPHAWGLRNTFVFDDRGVIVNNPAVTGMDLKSIWTKSYWPNRTDTNLYRPLTSTTFALDWKLGGGHASLFVAVNLLLHIVTTLVAFRLLRALFPRKPGMAAAAALLFAIHPLHVEAVVGIVGRAELMAALFSLIGYVVWLEAERDRSDRRRLLAAGMWFLALLSKESAVMLPVVLLAHRVGLLLPASSERRLRAADLAWPAALLLAILLRAQALGGLAAPRPSHIDNPLVTLGPLLRVLGAAGVLARQGLQVLTGQGLSADYSYAQIDPGPSLYLLGAIVLAILVAGTLWALRSARRNAAGWGILFFLSFWLLTSNIPIAIGTVQADRLLYLPLLGLIAAAVTALGSLTSRARPSRLAVVGLCGIVGYYGVVAARRTSDWRTDRTLFESALRVAPRSVKVRSNLSALILNEKDPAAAPRVLSLLDPIADEARGFGPYLHWRGKAHLFLGQFDQARSDLRAALAAHSDSAETLVELGNLAIQEENGVEALACFSAVARTGKLEEHSAIGIASSYALLGRYDEAANAWLPIVASLPDSIPVRAACAWNLVEAGRAAEAAQLLKQGLDRRSDPRLWTSLARAYHAGAGSAGEALDAIERGDGSDPELADSIREAAGLIDRN